MPSTLTKEVFSHQQNMFSQVGVITNQWWPQMSWKDHPRAWERLMSSFHLLGCCWAPYGTEQSPGSNHPPTPGTLKPNCQFYSQIPKLNPSKHSDDLRFSKPIDHSVSDAGSQGELPVLGEEAGGGGGRGRPLQRTVRKEQLTITQRSPCRSSA